MCLILRVIVRCYQIKIVLYSNGNEVQDNVPFSVCARVCVRAVHTDVFISFRRHFISVPFLSFTNGDSENDFKAMRIFAFFASFPSTTSLLLVFQNIYLLVFMRDYLLK